ncbi:TraR/DksA family transcriptional regulator [Spirochaeta dissipatitropha]
MDKEFTARMHDKLVQMKGEILDNLASENKDFDDIIRSGEGKDIADIASTDIDKRMLSTLGSQEVKRLRLIEAALSRIKNNHYGICLGTGKPIPKERLEAIPYALYCIEYQNEIERRTR